MCIIRVLGEPNYTLARILVCLQLLKASSCFADKCEMSCTLCSDFGCENTQFGEAALAPSWSHASGLTKIVFCDCKIHSKALNLSRVLIRSRISSYSSSIVWSRFSAQDMRQRIKCRGMSRMGRAFHYDQFLGPSFSFFRARCSNRFHYNFNNSLKTFHFFFNIASPSSGWEGHGATDIGRFSRPFGHSFS